MRQGKLGVPMGHYKRLRSLNEQKVSKRFPFDPAFVQSQPLWVIKTVNGGEMGPEVVISCIW